MIYRIRKKILILILAIQFVTITHPATDVYAYRKNGWTLENNQRYYYSNGVKKKGWILIGSKWYFLDLTTGAMAYSQLLTWKGSLYYLKQNGIMATDSIHSVNGKLYYFNEDGVAPSKCWIVYNDNKYYAKKNHSLKVNSWLTLNNIKYYFNSEGVLSSQKAIENKISTTESTGIATDKTANPTEKNQNYNSIGAKTIKALLSNAMKPVGSTLYIWGGGHDDGDASRIGVNANWLKWYNKFDKSYNYANYKYKYGYGLDCSGFVGWSIYNTLNSKSGNKPVVTYSTQFPSMLAGKGWGSTSRISSIANAKYNPGDVVSMSGHVWLIVGQCSDGSVVLVHSTPPVVQLTGTCSSTGSTSSQAIKLARNYMKQYYGNCYNKFKGSNGNISTATKSYLYNVTRFRWSISSSSIMKDPEGYSSKNASSVLADLFS